MEISKLRDKYLLWIMQKNYSAGTVANYRHSLLEFGIYLHDKIASTITLDDVIGFSAFLKSKGYADSTQDVYKRALKGMLKFAYLQGYVSLNPDFVPFAKIAPSQSYMPAERHHLDALLKANNEYHDSYYLRMRNEAVLKFLFSTGVRNAELRDLTINELDMGKREAIIITKKAKRKRLIMWDEETHQALVKWMEIRETRARCNAVFVGRFGEKLALTALNTVFMRLRKHCGMKDHIVPHSFRHGFGFWGVANNINPRYLQIMLGHSRLQSTEIYMPFKDYNVKKEYQDIYAKRSEKEAIATAIAKTSRQDLQLRNEERTTAGNKSNKESKISPGRGGYDVSGHKRQNEETA